MYLLISDLLLKATNLEKDFKIKRKTLCEFFLYFS